MRLGLTRPQQRASDSIRNDLNQLLKVGRMAAVPIGGLRADSDLKTRGAQVTFQITSLQGVDSFVLLRNFSRDPGAAKQIHVWSAKSLKSTPQTYPINLQHTDADPAIAGQKAYYWIKAVPASDATTENTFLSGPQEFDASNLPTAKQIAGDFAQYQSYTPTTSPLSATTGGPANSATITIAPFQQQYPFDANGDGAADLVNYSGGSVTPLLDATAYFVYYDDPTYAGGAVTYIATTDSTQVTAGLHRQYVGTITTPAHGAGGTTGGGGGSGPCFSGNTRVVTKRGHVAISDVKPGDFIYSRNGWKKVAALIEHNYDGEMREMGSGELVTPGHRMYMQDLHTWLPAKDIFHVEVRFNGNVFNLVLIGKGKTDNSRCYLLKNGWYAHNLQKRTI
jgi:hypothetical protein